jgi:hypothetical protein
VDPDSSFFVGAGVDSVDVLFVIPNFGWAADLQTVLGAAGPALFGEILADTGLHVGVVSTDMGTMGSPEIYCEDPEDGDDGVLLHTPPEPGAGCESDYPAFLTGPDASLAEDFGCVTSIGVGGCSWQQPHAAMEKALTVHAAAGGPNEGFLRSDALLAVVWVDFDDDCSTNDAQMFSDDESLGPVRMRCTINETDRIRPPSEFADVLASLKPGRPELLLAAGFLGLPRDLVPPEITPDALDAVLADPRMTHEIDYSPEGGGATRIHACDPDDGDLVYAFPSRRPIELIERVLALGGGADLESVCALDWGEGAARLGRAIESQRLRAGGRCTSAALADAGGTPIRCALYDTRPGGGACEGDAVIDRGLVGGDRACEICQVGETGTDAFGMDVSACPGDRGWSYEPAPEVCDGTGRVVFTSGSEPGGDAILWLECRWPAS